MVSRLSVDIEGKHRMSNEGTDANSHKALQLRLLKPQINFGPGVGWHSDVHITDSHVGVCLLAQQEQETADTTLQ